MPCAFEGLCDSATHRRIAKMMMICVTEVVQNRVCDVDMLTTVNVFHLRVDCT